MSKASEARDEKARCIAKLREWLKPGATVYCILRSTSRSGMQRCISVLLSGDGDAPTGRGAGVWEVSGYVAHALGMRRDYKRGGLIVGGCGMDMGYHIVHSLGSVLYPEGFGCTGEGCPSNDHSNGDRDYTPHGHRGPRYVPGPGARETLAHWHTTGGYALKMRWL